MLNILNFFRKYLCRVQLFPTVFHKVLIIVFFLNCTLHDVQADEWVLPQPGAMMALSPSFQPLVLRGIKLDARNPFRLSFLIDAADTHLNTDGFKDEARKVIKYFLTALTVPDQDLWVNLSPYEKQRMIAPVFGKTLMGRDLLAQDYILKQITSSLIYPEGDLGRRFWAKIYAVSYARYGTTHIPVSTFNKVWIMPDHARVYVRGGSAFVIDYHLKVLLEEDYLALDKNKWHRQGQRQISTLSSAVIRTIVLPELEKEVNNGKNFAALRQIFYALILAAWYKDRMKEAVLNGFYTDKNKTASVLADNPQEKEKIYQRYLQAVKKGVFNYIKEDLDTGTHQSIPRKYFSGGVLGRIDRASIAYLTQWPSNVSGEHFWKIEGSAQLVVRDDSKDKAMLFNSSGMEAWRTVIARIDHDLRTLNSDRVSDKRLLEFFNVLGDYFGLAPLTLIASSNKPNQLRAAILHFLERYDPHRNTQRFLPDQEIDYLKRVASRLQGMATIHEIRHIMLSLQLFTQVGSYMYPSDQHRCHFRQGQEFFLGMFPPFEFFAIHQAKAHLSVKLGEIECVAGHL